jgi:protein SCO1/2
MFDKIVEGFKKSPYLWTALISMTVITILTPLTRRVPQPPPVVSTVPEFSLVGPDGTAFGSRELAGRIYIASFIFTRCQSICPMIVQHLTKLQNQIIQQKIPLTLVSITVDPENDTPSVLKSFAEKSGANSSVWTFLTGTRESITHVVEKGFTVGMGAPAEINGLMDIAHSQKLILVDNRGRIRGFYDATTEGVEEIFARAEAVVGETLL